jgi:hypothetical protein
MHLADALARRRRYATGLVAGDDEQPRFFCFARGGVTYGSVATRFFASRIEESRFFGARDRFAACFFPCGLARCFNASFLIGLVGGSFAARLFPRGLARCFNAAFLVGLAGGSFAARLFPRGLARCFNASLLIGLASGSFAARLFPRGLAHGFDAAFLIGGAGGRLTARFVSRGLPGGLANGVKTPRLFGLAGHGIARVAALLGPSGLPGRRLLASGILPSRLIACTVAARPVIIPLAAGPAVAVAPVRFALTRMLVAVVALALAVGTAFVFDVVSSRTDIAFGARGWLRLRIAHRCTDRAPVGWVVAAALSDHPVEPLIDRQVDALRLVALSLARLRAEASQIPRTARFHPRAQTTSDGAVCAPLSGRRW